MSASSFSFAAISTLLSTSHFFSGRFTNPSRIFSTFGPAPARPSTTIRIRSASDAPSHAAATMARSSRRLGAKMPGVSTRMICASPSKAMPIRRVRVVCALGLTIATFCPTNALTRVDLPALGAPIMATWPQRCVMHFSPERPWRRQFQPPVCYWLLPIPGQSLLP